METYQNVNGNSGIAGYEIGDTWYDHQLHSHLYSFYDKGAPHGWAGPLLWYERTFPQCHHG